MWVLTFHCGGAVASSVWLHPIRHRRDPTHALVASRRRRHSPIAQSIEPKNICVKTSYPLRRRRVRHVHVGMNGQHGLVVLVRHHNHEIVLLQAFQNLFQEF